MNMHANFESFPYTRPDLENLTKRFDQHLEAFESASDAEAQLAHLDLLMKIREEFSTMYNLCYIRHTSNTGDTFYEQENSFFDQHLPDYEGLNNRLYKAALASPFRTELEQRIGKHFFVLAHKALATFQPSILSDMQEENTLSTEYTRHKAQAKVTFEGTTYNLSGIYVHELSSDRARREAASRTKWSFYAANADHIDGIFDKMVKARHSIAKKLGATNFVETGYARMRRSDYTPDMVANFRKQVREYIVPIASKLYERQRVRLGLDRLLWYDEDFKFRSGNPKPIGTPEQIVANAADMYQELSADTHAFFTYMQQANLMDLVNRDGKAPGGYCTYMGNFKAPYIFSNFNGTSGDIDVLTHEAGHAFQVWSSGQQFTWEEYLWPTSDAAEIHSMSMEFLTWPWMEHFFGPDVDKYRFMHMSGCIQFIPYGVAVDEFQHIVYANPDMTPAERHAAWHSLEQIYLPHRTYVDMPFLEQGGFWQKQSHIFNHPFYYIDYTLAQICAFQFWMRDRQDHASTWQDYVKLCQAGGSKSFLNLVALAGLRSPFEDGCVASVVGDIEQFLDSIDDRKF
jgi:M3 family oligoendopeptidase